MKRRLLIIAFVLALAALTAIDALAQAVPNRDYKKAISDIALTCPAAFTNGADGKAVFKNAPVSDAFRRQVIPYFASELNKLDGGNWAVLYRMDRQDETPEPGRLTTDVVIWKPTREHFDTMDDKKTSWGLIGPLPNDKDWFVRDPSEFVTVCGTPEPQKPPVDPVKPPPLPPPPPTSDVSKQLEALSAQVGELQEAIGLLGAAILELQGMAEEFSGQDLPCFTASSRVLGNVTLCPQEK